MEAAASGIPPGRDPTSKGTPGARGALPGGSGALPGPEPSLVLDSLLFRGAFNEKVSSCERAVIRRTGSLLVFVR